MPTARLSINPDTENRGNFYVIVRGEGFHPADNNATVFIRVRGSDKWVDDKLFNFPDSPTPLRYLLDPGLTTFTISKNVPGSKLNEDWGDDEVYAIVQVTGFSDVKTNIVKGNWS